MSHPHDQTFGRQLFLGSEVAAEFYVDEVLDGAGNPLYVDSMVSVSAVPDRPTTLWPGASDLEDQCRRLLNAVEVRDGHA